MLNTAARRELYESGMNYDSQITVFMWSRQKVKGFTVEIKSTLTYNVGANNYNFVFHSTAKEGNNTFVVKTRFEPK